MNIFSTITLRTMKQSRMRTVVTIIGVILSTAMITAVTTFGCSIWSYLLDYSIQRDGNWYGAAAYVSSSELERIREDSRVEMAAATDILGYAEYEKLTSVSMPYLYIQSLPEGTWEICPAVLEEGRLPENETEVIIPDFMTANEETGQETKIGDTLELDVGERMLDGERLPSGTSYCGEDYSAETGNAPETLENLKKMKFTVVGIYSQMPDMYQAASYGVYAGPSGSGSLSDYHNVYLRTARAGDIYDYMDTVKCDSTTVNTGLLRWLGVADNDNLSGILIGLIAIVIGIIMAGAISLIYNAFSISLRERTVQFGLLSSMGATKKQLRRSLRYEALFVSCIGIPLGCIAGTVGIGITLHFIGKGLTNMINGEALDIPLKISWGSVLAAVVLAFATVMISVWIPCRRVRRISPVEAVRASQDIRIRKKDVKTSGLSYKLFGLPGMLAQKNYKRDRKKYRSTVISLTMSILLFVSVSSFGKYLTDTGRFVMEMPDIQLLYSVNAEDSVNVPDDMKEAERVIGQNENVTFMQSYRGFNRSFVISLDEDEIEESFLEAGMRSGYISAMEPGGIRMYVTLCALPDDIFEQAAEGADAESDDGLPLLYPSQVKIYDPITQRYEGGTPFAYGDRELMLENEEYTEEGEPEAEQLSTACLQAAYEKAPAGVNVDEFGVTLLTSESGYQKYLRGHEDKVYSRYEMGVRCENHGEAFREISDELEKAENTGYFYDNAEDYEENRQILTALAVLSYGFIILISLIAVANVFNTVSTNLMLRRKEFAMLRSVGMDRKGFRRMMCYECLIYGLRSILYGLILSLLVSMLIWRVLAGGVDTNYIVPWEYLGIASLSVFIVVGVTMVYTMGLIRKENIIDELKMN